MGTNIWLALLAARQYELVMEQEETWFLGYPLVEYLPL